LLAQILEQLAAFAGLLHTIYSVPA